MAAEPEQPPTDQPADEPEPTPTDGDELEHDQDEPEQPPPAPPVEARDEREIAKAEQKLAAEATRHANRVSEIMGEDAQALTVCPLCWHPGFVWPADTGFPPDEQREAVLAFLGVADTPDYLPATDAAPCDACGALGLTLTGSKVPGQETKPCVKCKGAGWIAAAEGQPYQLPTLPPLASVPPLPPPAIGNGATDNWGRPVGHPHYGIEPARVYT